AFAINNANQCVSGNSFSFTNLSSIAIGTMTYQWYFGNGMTSTAVDPTTTYASSGAYGVKLVVTSDKGCKDSIMQLVTIFPKPLPQFTVNSPVQCIHDNSYSFTNLSKISSRSEEH